MADGVKITIEGDKELVAFLQNAHDEAVLLAGMESAMAGALRMRTRLRRAAPVGQNSKSRIKAGWPRLSEVMRAKGGDIAPIAWAGMMGPRQPYFLKVLDVGRKAFRRRGKTVAGSPPMNPWWNSAVSSAGPEVQDVMMRKLIEQLRKRIPAVIAKYGAPLKFR
jgi:hypothetical protein